jgi:DNA-binding transcriptional ArsR family regulator
MMSVLEGDILYRGKLLALEGTDSLLGDLHPTITYQDKQIQVSHACNHAHCPHEVTLQGTGIQIVPTIFTPAERMIQITPEWHPMIVYSARGIGIYCQETRASRPLELALGAARARILQLLTTPATTGEVAYKAQISASSASEHLSRLTKAGLAEPRRSGKRVYYRLTQRGSDLIALFERMN